MHECDARSRTHACGARLARILSRATANAGTHSHQHSYLYIGRIVAYFAAVGSAQHRLSRASPIPLPFALQVAANSLSGSCSAPRTAAALLRQQPQRGKGLTGSSRRSVAVCSSAVVCPRARLLSVMVLLWRRSCGRLCMHTEYSEEHRHRAAH